MKHLLDRKRWLGTVLDVIGLAVAFTAFMVIMVQVRYDWTYDRNYRDHEKIFRFEFPNDPTDAGSYSTTISRPFIESLKGTIPEVEAIGACRLFSQGTSEWYKEGNLEQKYDIHNGWMDSDMLKVFPFDILEGDASDFSEPESALISKSTAELMFPGESPVGKYIASSDYGNPRQIVAVYRDFPENSTPASGIILQLGQESLNNWSEWSYQCFMKLNDPEQKDKVTRELTLKMLDALDASPDSDRGKVIDQGLRITNPHNAYFSHDVSGDPMAKGNKATTNTLFLIGIVIILIAIINFINFATASVPLIIKNINTRKVLGSSRAALVVKQLSEALVLAAAAFAIAVLAIHLLSTTSFTYYISGSLKIADNIRILLIGAGTAVFTALVAGLFPALYSTSFQPAMVLKGSFSLTPKGRMIRSTMVGFQFLASFILIAVAAFIQIQTSYMKHMDMGFRHDLVVEFVCGSEVGRKADLFEQKLRENPHIKDVTFAGNNLVSLSKMGWGREMEGQYIQIDVLPVSSDFLDFFGLQIKEGRGFTRTDDLNPDGTVIMNEQAMLRFPFLRIGGKFPGHAENPAEIIGVVKDFNFMPMQYNINPFALYDFGSRPWWPLWMAYAKIDGADIPSTFSYIRETLHEFYPGIDADDLDVHFLDDTIGKLYQKEEKLTSLIAITAILSLIISLTGILGIVSFETQFRRKEIAIRKVHGATVGEILKMMNRHYIIMTLICFVISVPISVFIMKTWVRSFAYQSPVPVWIFIADLVAVMAVTVLTVTLMSRSAAMQNPAENLRNE